MRTRLGRVSFGNIREPGTSSAGEQMWKNTAATGLARSGSILGLLLLCSCVTAPPPPQYIVRPTGRTPHERMQSVLTQCKGEAAATPQSLYISGGVICLVGTLAARLLKMMQSFRPVWRETAIRKQGGKALESVELSRRLPAADALLAARQRRRLAGPSVALHHGPASIKAPSRDILFARTGIEPSAVAPFHPDFDVAVDL
jgi:hypothetical protein